VRDPDQTITWSRDDELQSRPWADDTAVDEGHPAADLTGGLVDLGFFTAALRRRAWVWCLTAVLGLVIGSGLYLMYPPAKHATATVLLEYSPEQNPQVEVQTEVSLAQSQPVAGRVVQQLKLSQSVASLQAAYTVTPVTDNVLMFNVGAPSSADAVQRVSALVTAFLQYRVQYWQTQQRQLFAQLDQQYIAAQHRLKVLDGEVGQLPNTPTGPPLTEYDNLATQISQQKQIMQYVSSTETSTKTNTNAIATGSYVLDGAIALPRPHVKGAGLYVVGGLFGGLVVGIAIVIFSALLSRGLRRRDDVAAAIGAPVKLSVGPLRARRWRPGRPRQAAKRNLDIKRVVAFLRGVVRGSFPGSGSLALVAVDDAKVAAQVVASLAASCVTPDKQIVVADLSADAQLARLLGVSDPGIHPVSKYGANLMVVLPGREEVAPKGPVPGGASSAVPAQADAALVSACSSADLLLTLVTLDPACGGDHLGTWATNAVALVTAGESSPEKIHSVGEMIRLAGTRLDSVVLIGADESDESLGVIDPAGQSSLINQV
jgi:capsular polysaccharide biosynthesis protein